MFENKAAKAYGEEITRQAVKAGANAEDAAKAGKLAAAVKIANDNEWVRQNVGLD